MKFDPQKHHRRPIRLKEYDYIQPGGYFITIVTYHRDCLFARIVNQKMQLNDYGHVIRTHEDWDRIHRYIETNPSRRAGDAENPIHQ